MQAISLDFQTRPYNADMQTGRPPKTERTPFGARLYQAREDKGLSQRQVAEELGVPLKTYANWERRSVGIKPEHLSQLAAVLGVTLDHLFGAEAAPKKQDGPVGKARRLFEEVSDMPRHQQQRILSALDDMIAGQKAKQAS